MIEFREEEYQYKCYIADDRDISETYKGVLYHFPQLKISQPARAFFNSQCSIFDMTVWISNLQRYAFASAYGSNLINHHKLSLEAFYGSLVLVYEYN
ncbi:MAG: hypothetical protein CL912_28155 [Deltaproteobacteria bacterium]|nr:hypothetical protein [Deltaproteobacteria bacterium]|tara:strand:+ start:642 stop:932 length:291 start_codon:yes stop_codon:yes gene_type:complete